MSAGASSLDPPPRVARARARSPVTTVLSPLIAGVSPPSGSAPLCLRQVSSSYRGRHRDPRDHSGLTLLMTSSPSAAASPSLRRLASVSSPSRLRLVSVWTPSRLRLPATCFPGGEGALPGAVLTASAARLKMGTASAPLKLRRPAAIRVSDDCAAT